jgi:excisionase family DNA binding protein
MENPLLRLRDAAGRLGLSPKTLRAMVARREIGCVRPGGPRGHIFIPQSEIDAHIRRHFRPAKGMGV